MALNLRDIVSHIVHDGITDPVTDGICHKILCGVGDKVSWVDSGVHIIVGGTAQTGVGAWDRASAAAV